MTIKNYYFQTLEQKKHNSIPPLKPTGLRRDNILVRLRIISWYGSNWENGTIKLLAPSPADGFNIFSLDFLPISVILKKELIFKSPIFRNYLCVENVLRFLAVFFRKFSSRVM